MPDSVLNSVLVEFSHAVKPLSEIDSAAKATALMKKLGYELQGGTEFTGIPLALLSKVGTIGEDIIALVEAQTDEDKTQALLRLASKVKDIAVKVADIAADMQAAGAASANFFANAPVDQLPRRLLDYIISVYMETYYSGPYSVLLLIGVFDELDTPADAGKFQPQFILRKVCWERLPKYVTEPQNLAEEIYQWQTNFNSDLFLTRLERLLRGFMLPGGIYNQELQAAMVWAIKQTQKKFVFRYFKLVIPRNFTASLVWYSLEQNHPVVNQKVLH